MKKNIKLTKMKALLLTLILTVGLLGSVMSVSAASITTREFGKFTYSLSKNQKSVTAKTKVAKTAPKLITSIEVQLNSTGKKISSRTKTNKKSKNCNLKTTFKKSNVKYAAFSSHEARGAGSVVRYKSVVF